MIIRYGKKISMSKVRSIEDEKQEIENGKIVA